MSVTFDHCGFVVTNLEMAVEFCTRVLGAQELRRGAISNPDGNSMSDIFGVSPKATAAFVFLSFGGAEIEMLEWSDPQRHNAVPGNSDVGARHLALRVSGFDQLVGTIRELPGFAVRSLSPRGFHYVKTPFGLELQLYPAGEA
ncbi:hypothetical protein BH23CHL5_BH23CHL5_17900 [soil metagenome]